MKIAMLVQVTATKPADNVKAALAELVEAFSGPELTALEVTGDSLYLEGEE